jgi:DNA-binding NtrC family response regulator
MSQTPVPATNPTRTVTVLSVSPNAEDHASLKAIFDRSKWQLFRADCLAAAHAIISRREIGVVICERDLSPGSWVDMLKEGGRVQNPPPLIVTSRLADERLWAEALNVGAYDVLAKPFDRLELVRSVSAAWLHWYHRCELPKFNLSAISAAG